MILNYDTNELELVYVFKKDFDNNFNMMYSKKNDNLDEGKKLLETFKWNERRVELQEKSNGARIIRIELYHNNELLELFYANV